MPRKSSYSSPEEAKLARKAKDKENRERLKQERIARGDCPCGKEKPKPGCIYGPICIAKQTVCSNSRYYKNKVKGGVCRYHGCPLNVDGKCDRCLEKKRNNKAAGKPTWYKRRLLRGLCPYCRKKDGVRPLAPGKRACEEHLPLARARQLKRYHRARKLVFDHYGRECACCGEPQIRFLQIDHIEGGGTKHLKKIGRGNLYYYLIRNKFPDGYRTLCCKCNFGRSKTKDGKCPHEHYSPEMMKLIRQTNQQLARLLNGEDQCA
jgi:hypothetical protein